MAGPSRFQSEASSFGDAGHKTVTATTLTTETTITSVIPASGTSPPETIIVISPIVTIVPVVPTIAITIGSPDGTGPVPAETGSLTTVPGTIPGQVIATTIFPSSPSLPPGSPINTASSALGVHPRSSRARLVGIAVGSVVGGLILLLLLLCLFLRWRRHQRTTGPILLADPYSEVRETAGQRQQSGGIIAMPQPSSFGAAMFAKSTDTLSPNPIPAKLSNLYPANAQDNPAHNDSITTTNSPRPSTSHQDTILEIQALRQRILEVENMALRQRIADVENTTRERQGTGEPFSTALRVERASESPPEYASPVEENPPPRQN